MPVQIGEYKGNPTISLTTAAVSKYPFTFGLAKARLIIKNIEAIKQFVKDNEGKNGNGNGH